jgi:hypothetical protein
MKKHTAAIVTIRDGVVHNLQVVTGDDEDKTCQKAEEVFATTAKGEGVELSDYDLDNGYVETPHNVGSSVCLAWGDIITV